MWESVGRSIRSLLPSEASSNSLLGMSRNSVAETLLFSMGVRGRLFGAPGVFISLAKPFLSFCKKKEMAEYRTHDTKVFFI